MERTRTKLVPARTFHTSWETQVEYFWTLPVQHTSCVLSIVGVYMKKTVQRQHCNNDRDGSSWVNEEGGGVNVGGMLDYSIRQYWQSWAGPVQCLGSIDGQWEAPLVLATQCDDLNCQIRPFPFTFMYRPLFLHPALTLQCIYKGSHMESASSLTAECPERGPRATKTN